MVLENLVDSLDSVMLILWKWLCVGFFSVMLDRWKLCSVCLISECFVCGSVVKFGVLVSVCMVV